ncbi:hypothetical protein [Flavobacterium ginsenosidimutans]|uniref:hypothetical protein n=1 Tax=Flavobacterium ginsenosidimutans TaxID=687844 RepID=UPI000DABF92A|nr:hypothetical protein [Flavobacterium ginsenosidimutans]KAF2331087.1 hypothetical protein DM444_12480 [Flavobacterium ginsenosidimutans]
MIGYIVFFVFLAIFTFACIRWGTFLISDLIAGLILSVFFTYCHFEDFNKGTILIFLMNLIFYLFQFISSVFIYFDKGNEKRSYWIFTVLGFVFLMVIEKMILNFNDAFLGMYLPIALAFFPIYFLKYYFKYIKEEV